MDFELKQSVEPSIRELSNEEVSMVQGGGGNPFTSPGGYSPGIIIRDNWHCYFKPV